MKNVCVVSLALVMSWFAAVSWAGQKTLAVEDAWIREAPPAAASLAGYMVVENRSDRPRTLVGGSSAAFRMVMMHRTVTEGGIAKMLHQREVVVPAGKSVTFAPNGYHLMLMRPKRALKSGDHVQISLKFKDGETLPVTFEVRRGAGMDMGQHDNHKRPHE